MNAPVGVQHIQPPNQMALNDLGSGRSSPYPYQSRNGANSPPLPSTSLSHAHITEALQNSPDNGATLDLTHRNLTDVGELGAEELATIGRKDSVDDESSVLRCDQSTHIGFISNDTGD